MGKGPIPTIVGGGITLVPGAIGEFLFITSIVPPEGSTSSRFRIVTAATPDQLVAESQAGMEDTTLGIGSSNTGIAAGNLRPDVIIGRNISVSHANVGANNAGVFIGQGINSAAGSGTGNVVIGPGFTQNGGNVINTSNVIIGTGTFQNLQSNSVVIGGGATTNANADVVVLGGGATVNGNGGVAIGRSASSGNGTNVAIGSSVTSAAARAVAIGQGHGCPNADMIKIGQGGQNAGTAGQILIGNSIDPNSVGTNEICMGHEANNFTVGFRFGQNQHTNGVACPAYTITHKSALGTNITAGDVTYNLPKATGNAAAGAFIIQTATPGASGATLQTNAEVARFSPGTATQPRNFQISIDKGLWFTNQTSGAGAGAGTLTNAPTAGDPTHWLRVRINGTDMFIPCWP